MHSKFYLHSRKNFLYCVGDHALEQIAQRGCGASCTGDIKKLLGQYPCALCSGMTLPKQGGWTR